MKDMIGQIAKEHGITEQEAVNEMKIAIRTAMQCTDPTAQAFWREIAPDGKEPPIEKVIAVLALKVRSKMLYCGAKFSELQTHYDPFKSCRIKGMAVIRPSLHRCRAISFSVSIDALPIRLSGKL